MLLAPRSGKVNIVHIAGALNVSDIHTNRVNRGIYKCWDGMNWGWENQREATFKPRFSSEKRAYEFIKG